MKVRIASKQRAADGIAAFDLVKEDGTALPPFTAGAHIDVFLANGCVRQYSLLGSPADQKRYRIAVLREVNSRGGSRAMHDLNEGDLLEISEPKNHFPLVDDAAHSVLLAGGIGVTPILSMAEQLLHSDASFEFHYCTREPSRAAFLERFSKMDMVDIARVYYDTGSPAQKIDLAAVLANPQSTKHLYVCGPGGFIEAVLNQAKALGWNPDNLHREFFAAPVQSMPSTQTQSFKVVLSSSGQCVDVAEDESVIEALARSGIELPTSCEQGVCGTCLTRIVQGVPDHRDAYLTDKEKEANNQFLPCCSRSKSPVLVLEL
jgi:vanillate O-demethylase ferredoxin subunit